MGFQLENDASNRVGIVVYMKRDVFNTRRPCAFSNYLTFGSSCLGVAVNIETVVVSSVSIR